MFLFQNAFIMILIMLSWYGKDIFAPSYVQQNESLLCTFDNDIITKILSSSIQLIITHNDRNHYCMHFDNPIIMIFSFSIQVIITPIDRNVINVSLYAYFDNDIITKVLSCRITLGTKINSIIVYLLDVYINKMISTELFYIVKEILLCACFNMIVALK